MHLASPWYPRSWSRLWSAALAITEEKIIRMHRVKERALKQPLRSAAAPATCATHRSRSNPVGLSGRFAPTWVLLSMEPMRIVTDVIRNTKLARHADSSQWQRPREHPYRATDGNVTTGSRSMGPPANIMPPCCLDAKKRRNAGELFFNVCFSLMPYPLPSSAECP